MAVTLYGGRGMQMQVDPALGGRITSLTTADGTEWLNSSTDVPSPAYGAPFLRPGMGGWDEVAPSVAADRVDDGTPVPDHGDVWNVPWEVLSTSDTSLSLQTTLTSVPVLLSRDISATPEGFIMSYTASTKAPGDIPFLWCAHPQFRADNGTSVILTLQENQHIPPLVVEYPNPGIILPFPTAPHLPTLPKGTSLKAFVLSPRPVQGATLSRAGGERLTITWNAEELPYLGIFWDNCEFAAEPAIALEPSTGMGDRLTSARSNQKVLHIREGSPLAWSLTVLADPP